MNLTELRSQAVKNYLATGDLCFSNSLYNKNLYHIDFFQRLSVRRILMAVRAEGAKSRKVIFLCPQETLQIVLLHFPTAQKSLFFFSIKMASINEKMKLFVNNLKQKPNIQVSVTSQNLNSRNFHTWRTFKFRKISDFEVVCKCNRLCAKFHVGTKISVAP